MNSKSTPESGYLYERIADELRDQIKTGEPLTPGARLPTQAELATTYHVSRNVIRLALDLLESEGLIDRVQGGRTVVRESYITDETYVNITNRVSRISTIQDPFNALRIATQRITVLQREFGELSRLRRRLITNLRKRGITYNEIADRAGLTRGRIHQIHSTTAEPEDA